MTQQKYRLAALVYAVVLTIASLQPRRPGGLHSSGFHAPLHLVFFGVLVLLAQRGFPGSRSLLWIVPACALLGLTIEMGQHWEFQEAIEWNDIVSDTIGAIGGGFLCLIGQKRRA
jgi:VanZ family protein